MSNGSVVCHGCKIAQDQSQLVLTRTTTENCPKCGSQLATRGQENLSWTNATRVANIEAWLSGYQSETSQLVKKRELVHSKKQIWAVGSPHAFAAEVSYDGTELVAVRMVNKGAEAIVRSAIEDLKISAAKRGFQSFGMVLTAWDYNEGRSAGCVWGIVQYVRPHDLTTGLLSTILARLSEAMQDAKSAVFGE